MAASTVPVHLSLGSQPQSGALRSVARQPILDQRGRVHAFRLHLRPASGPDGSPETPRQTLEKTSAYFKLSRPSELKSLTGKMMGFVACPPEAIGEELEQLFPANLTVLEIPANLEAPPELIEQIEKVKALGFRLALRDLRWDSHNPALLPLADTLEVDFTATDAPGRRALMARLSGTKATLMATGVELPAQHRLAWDEGFHVFEGYYFTQPAPARNRRPPANQLLRIEILKALQQNPMNLPKVADLVKRDGPLAYQLLRFTNSPLFALRQQVESIHAALLAVGEDAFRRIATLAIASEFNGDQPSELLCMAMIRGRFCEVASAKLDLEPFSQYLLGLLSLLPAMQGQPMKELVAPLPLSEEVRAALLGTRNRERVLLAWLENTERGNWAGCDAEADADRLNQQELAKLYVESVAWAETALHSGS
jgi:EAL and modified HD-GYP domain-containing signal transduction protein